VAQPLPPWLVTELRIWFEAGGGTWGRFPKAAVKVLRADLKVAGVDYWTEDADGRACFDFHSLRRWYVTWAANHPGISPKLLKELTRLASPQLALDTYAGAQQGEARRTVADLPRPGSGQAK
jgi:hypothetical protein